MGLKAYYLGDTSALDRLAQPAIAARLVPLLESGLVARCTPTDLEAGFSSSSPAAHLAMRHQRAAWPLAPMNQDVLDRAVHLQDALANRSQHGGAKIADLLIAAAAEAAGLVVLHYDHDYDLIAQVSGQPTEWIAPLVRWPERALTVPLDPAWPTCSTTPRQHTRGCRRGCGPGRPHRWVQPLCRRWRARLSLQLLRQGPLRGPRPADGPRKPAFASGCTEGPQRATCHSDVTARRVAGPTRPRRGASRSIRLGGTHDRGTDIAARHPGQ